MARASTRSQRQPSQSQQPRGTQRASQSQRSQRARVEEEEADDDDDAMLDEDGDGANEGLERMANDLVRLALFSEQRRVPFRRDDISKKVLGPKSRAFGEVYTRAQEILRKTFGMEIVELLARTEAEDSNTQKEMEAMNVKKKSTATGTKTFILRSILEPGLIEAANQQDGELFAVEQGEKLVSSDDEVEQDNAVGTRSVGSIFAWHSGDQLGSIGILYVILALILVNGRNMSDNQLRANMKTLNLVPTASVPFSNQSTHQDLTIDGHLNQLIRQGFLERYRAGEAKGAKKRGRAPAPTQGDDSANTTEWRWGPRATSEVGEKDMAKFVANFMAQRDGDGEDETNATRAKTQQRVEKLTQGIEKAAGVKLRDILGK
ncbi:hypothetical protein EIP91_009177 [Steccherinum ochraceum]|uniref:MAGE domain-containing protein n=1 Tax=Steccherinum ochraceum TaxID=92696 RepID=A0A4V2MV35_9APHY|nr:hypothetical protein EIP91_009177 [Steccherinum ochraceum]